MDIDNSVIYSHCRRHILIKLKKFMILCVILVMHFSEKGPVGISRLSRGLIGINI